MKTWLLALVMCLGVLACREEPAERMDGGFSQSHAQGPRPPAPQVIYRDSDRRSDEDSVLDTYLKLRMLDSLFGNDRRDVHHYHSAPTVVRHETVVHHVAPPPAPAPTPAAAPKSSSWWSSSKSSTAGAAAKVSAPSGFSAPAAASKPMPVKSSSYGFKAPSRPVSTSYRAAPSRPSSFRSSSAGRR